MGRVLNGNLSQTNLEVANFLSPPSSAVMNSKASALRMSSIGTRQFNPLTSTSGGMNQSNFQSITSSFLPSSHGGMSQPTAFPSLSSGGTDQLNFIPPSISGGNGQPNTFQPSTSGEFGHTPAFPFLSSGGIGQPNFIPSTKPGGIGQTNPFQPSTLLSGGTQSLTQVLSDQNLQLDLIGLKVPMDKFSPWKHVPLNWLDNFEKYCNSVCQTYNTSTERFVSHNLYSLLADADDKKWLIAKMAELQPFSWFLLKQELVNYLAKKRNDKLKQVYMCEWDEPKTYAEYAKEKFKALKEIRPGQQLKNLMDIVQSGLPDDVNISMDKFHIPYEDEDFFLSVFELEDCKREQAVLEMENEADPIAHDETRFSLNSTRENEPTGDNPTETDAASNLEYERQQENRQLLDELKRFKEEQLISNNKMLQLQTENDTLVLKFNQAKVAFIQLQKDKEAATDEVKKQHALNVQLRTQIEAEIKKYEILAQKLGS